jgi:hypothetical protein
MDRYEIIVRNNRWEAVLAPEEDAIRFCPEFMSAVEALLGPGAVRVRPLEGSLQAIVG